jgi:hypothetical protein
LILPRASGLILSVSVEYPETRTNPCIAAT